MNAPETIKPINDAHKVLMEANDALCVEDVARAILGGDKPTKADIKAAAKRLKELADLGMIEMEPRAGGVPFYRLIAAPPSVVTHNPHTGTPRNPLDIESAPSGLLIVKDGEPLKAASKAERVLTPEAEAEREDFEARYGMLGNCSCHISPPCGSCTHPGNPRNQEEDETAWMAAGDSEGGETDAPAARIPAPEYDPASVAFPADFASDPALQYLAPEDYEMPPADPALLASANRMLCNRLEAVAEAIRASTIPSLEGIAGAEDLAPHVKTLCDALAAAESVVTARGHTINGYRLEVADLRERLDAQIKQWQADTGRLAADLRAAMESRSQAINEADRLRAELATERQAREALQEQSGVIQAAGYVLKAPKRLWRSCRNESSAKSIAMAAARRGIRIKAFALVPIGEANPGAEWRDA